MIRLPIFAAPLTDVRAAARDAARVATVVVLIALACVPSAHAQSEPAPLDPWSREVAVADRGTEERRAAQALAMREVLLANSGDKTLLNRDEVRAGLRDAETYVARFDYRTPPAGTLIAAGTPLTDTVRASGQATQLIRVAFDRERLGALIDGDGVVEEEDVPLDAGAVDPLRAVDTALVWLLIEDERREILISDPAARNVRARAREIAGARGVTLRYPTGDEEDRAALGADDIRQGNLPRLRLAAERYAVPVVLVGRLGRDGLGAWEGEWTKFAGETSASERFATESLDEALQAGLAWLSSATPGSDDGYRYGGGAGSDTEALVWVGPLDSLTAYARVMDFLAGVPGVGTVYPKEIDARGMTFTVVPRGALPAIASAADALAWLRRTNPPTEPAGTGADGVRGAGGAGGVYRATGASVRSGAYESSGAANGRGADAVAPLARNAELAFDYLR